MVRESLKSLLRHRITQFTFRTKMAWSNLCTRQDNDFPVQAPIRLPFEPQNVVQLLELERDVFNTGG